jgi:hypothetical protein
MNRKPTAYTPNDWPHIRTPAQIAFETLAGVALWGTLLARASLAAYALREILLPRVAHLLP